MSEELKQDVSRPRDTESAVSRAPVPVWLVVLMLVLLFVGAVYFDTHGAWFNSQVYAPYESAHDLALYQPKSGEADLLAQGRAVYDNVCSACHSEDGLGKPAQAPPLAGSEWVAGDIQKLAHVPLAGLSGSIEVKGRTWSLSMPPMGAALSDAQLAAVLSYIRSSWGNKSDAVTADQIKAVRAGQGGNLPSPAAWAKMTPIERGREIYQQYGCAQCHGPDGQGGVPNANAKTAQQVPALIHVADGYSKSELIAFISKGERNVPRMDPNGPPPPRFMPAWGGVISGSNLDYLADYLFSLKPKEQDLGF